MTHLCRHAILPKWILLSLGWFFLMIYALLFESSTSLGGVPVIPYLDKAVHFGLFFGQFCLLGRAFIYLPNRLFWTILITFAVLFAFGTELGQRYLTNTRSMEFWDGMADMVGAIVALGLVRWAKSQRRLSRLD